MKARALSVELGLVGLPTIVESRLANNRDANGASNTSDPAIELMMQRRVRRKADGHKIFQLGNPVFVQEARHEDVRRGPIKLLVPDPIGNGSDLKSAAFFII